MLSLMKGALIGTCLLVAAGVRDAVCTIEEDQKVIGSEKAEEIAYKHAGICDDGTTCLVTEGYYGEAFTYEIDAWEGTILNVKVVDVN